MKHDKRYTHFHRILPEYFFRGLGLLMVVSLLGFMLASFQPAQAHTPPSTHSSLAQDGNTPPPPDDTPSAPPRSGARVDTEEESSNLQLIFSLTFLLSIIAMLGTGYYIIERSNRKEQASQAAPTGASSSEEADSARRKDSSAEPGT